MNFSKLKHNLIKEIKIESYSNKQRLINHNDYNKLKGKQTCKICGRKCTPEVHHIIPVSAGGPNTMVNLINLCKDCHEYAHLKDNEATISVLKLLSNTLQANIMLKAHNIKLHKEIEELKNDE